MHVDNPVLEIHGKESSDDIEADVDLALQLLNGPRPVEGVLHYSRAATAVRSSKTQAPERWQRFKQFAEESGVIALFRTDPLTRHSAEQPRGYAGDAYLLDLIYDHKSVNQALLPTLSPIAVATNVVVMHSLEADAVRWRKKFIAMELNKLARSQRNARVLSVASGHARELHDLSDFARSSLDSVVVLDQDALSIEQCVRSHGELVTPLQCEISHLIRGSQKLKAKFDLVYSLGLFDYLDDWVASLLLKRLTRKVVVGGQVIYANFAAFPTNVGFMETAMRWNLIYRTETDMRRVWETTGIEGFDFETFRDPTGTVVYARLTRHS